MSALPIGVLASGTGTNFDAIARATNDGHLAADIRVVVCNRPGAKVLSSAEQLGIATESLDHDNYNSRESFDRDVVSRLEHHGVELVVMAGFDRIVTSVLLEAFPNRVINIHPALLPAFKGLDAQTQAAEYGVRIAGATVHLVDGDLDHGPIIVQAAVPVAAGEDAETVRLRILEQEHRIYPYAIGLFAEGLIRVEGRQVFIDGNDDGRADGEVLVSPSIHRTSR
jgi:phosphoribosylglycinamide formyltransferase-1